MLKAIKIRIYPDSVQKDFISKQLGCCRLKNELYDIISTHSGQTLSRIKKDADRDFWMSSEEAKSYGTKGMIDKILTSK